MLNKQTTAVLVIDMQVDFCSPEGSLARERHRDLSDITPTVERIVDFLPKVEKHLPVFYVHQVYDPQKLTPLQKKQYGRGKIITCDIETDDWKLYKVDPDPGVVFPKYNYNAFSNKDLIDTLERKGIDTLVIMGFDTQICVETAVRNAFDLGYQIYLIRDLVATNGRHRDMHEHTLRLVDKYYGHVVAADDILELLV